MFQTLFGSMHIPDSFTSSVCSPQANPVEVDDEKPPASLSQREESRGALGMGLRRNFSKDEPESRAHDAARKTQHSRCDTSRLEEGGM